MRLILTDDVFNLGKRGQVVDVAAGYGRNYLLPKGLALPATEGNLKVVEQQKVALVKKEAKLAEEAEILAAELAKLHVVVSRKAGDTGALFGSVTAKNLTDLLDSKGIHLDHRKIALEHPIKSLGNFPVDVHPHAGVDTRLLVSVVPEEGEVVERILEKGPESERIVADTDATVKKLRATEEGTREDLMVEPEEAEEAEEAEKTEAS